MLKADLLDMGVPPTYVTAYVAATTPYSSPGSQGRSGTGVGGTQNPDAWPTATGINPTGNQPASGPTPVPTLGPSAPATDPGTDPNTGLPFAPPVDWSAYLTNWGFTPDIVNELTRIFKVYTDPNQASAAALAYIRGTDWYKTTFPGIQKGESVGLFSNEAGYRSYVNDVNQYYQHYYSRSATTQEVSDALNAGISSTAVGQHLQGQAYIAANQQDIQYTLGAFDSQGRATNNELSAYGDQLSGLSNLIGPQLQARLDKARQKLSTIFQGTLASPSVSLLSNGRPAATSFGAGTTPDVSA